MGIDASSFNEARRALLAGVPLAKLTLTTQQVPAGDDFEVLKQWMKGGLLYNVCSLLQLERIAAFAAAEKLPLSMRVSPGMGSGESATRNTGDKYSCFGIAVEVLPEALRLAATAGARIEQVHVHIGSGGDPALWRSNIDRMLEIVVRFFPEATTLNLGGGFREARMPDELPADVTALGLYAKERFEAFQRQHQRKLRMAVEPGTYLVANAGYLVTQVTDKKWSGPGGFHFLLLNAGMEALTRPLLYGSRHPFYVLSRSGKLLSSEFEPDIARHEARVIVGRCCESGDSQTLDEHGHVVPRPMADPVVGDYVVIGGAGAYCSNMTLVGYNSYVQLPEVLVRADGSLQLIRRRQTLEQLLANELSL